jgi:hypothetical protein
MKCQCGFTTDPDGNCNGTHKVVRAVRDKIVYDIENISIIREDTGNTGC